MAINAKNINHLWATVIVEELSRQGANYFCLSPGSRSTPLTVAAAENSNVRTFVCYDERGAAYHALGYARATGKPAVLVCTSGTAAANYMPAIIEASMEALAMIVLTSDRPPELRETMANQTIRQPALYGDYTRWQFDLPCPHPDVPLKALLTTTDQLYFRSVSPHAGPVHLNCMFREPLAPVEEKLPLDYIATIDAWANSETPYTQAYPAKRHQPLSELESILPQTESLIVIGRLNTGKDILALRKWIGSVSWPVYADITSGLRVHGQPQIVDHMDLMLLSPALRKRLAKTPILHIGGPVVSKRFYQFLETEHQAPYILCAPNTIRQDPAHHVTARLEIDPEILTTWKPQVNQSMHLENVLFKANRAVQTILRDELPEFSEPGIIRKIMQITPDHHHLFISNSMPIRDADMFCNVGHQDQMVVSNRGASGIDGNLATAIGFSQGQNAPVTVIIGDLSLIHDLSSLSQTRSLVHPLIIVAINNGGGGIFHFLPIARYDVFEEFFAAPHEWNFEHLAKQFHLVYHQPKTLQELETVYQDALKRSSSTLLEVKTDRHENYKIHRVLNQIIRKSLDAI